MGEGGRKKRKKSSIMLAAKCKFYSHFIYSFFEYIFYKNVHRFFKMVPLWTYVHSAYDLYHCSWSYKYNWLHLFIGCIVNHREVEP